MPALVRGERLAHGHHAARACRTRLGIGRQHPRVWKRRAVSSLRRCDCVAALAA